LPLEVLMQLKDVVKTVDEMTDEELMERLQQIRHNREVVRPSAAKIAARPAKLESRAKVSALDKSVGKLSPAEKAELIRQLTEGK
jgi:hypothetical protein